MYRIDTANAAVAMPAPLGAGVMGYFQDTGPVTDLSADWFNMIQEELVYCLTMRGGTLDKADYHQLWDEVLLAEQAIKSDAADTTAVTTDVTCVVMASNTSRAVGANAAVVASSGASVASGAVSAVVGAGTGVASGITSAVVGGGFNTASGARAVVIGGTTNTASGNNSAVIASDGSGTLCEASGLQSAVVASEDDCEASGVDSLVAACDGDGGSCTASGTQSAVIASTSVAGLNTLASGATSAIIASASAASATVCAGVSSAIIASGNAETDGAHGYQAILACDTADTDADDCLAAAANDVAVSGARSAVISGKGYELNDADTLGGGYNAGALTPSGANQNLTWKIDASTGDAYLAGDLEVGVNVNTEAGAKVVLDSTNGGIKSTMGSVAFGVAGTPTDAELDTASGTDAATAGAGYALFVQDATTGAIYHVMSDGGTKWLYSAAYTASV